MYTFLDHPADVLVLCEGSTLNETVADAARAMFETIADTGAVDPCVEKEFGYMGSDLKDMVHGFLSDLLFSFETEGILYSQFDVHAKEETFELKAVCRGEPYSPEKHEPGTEVKAVTYHMMEVKRVDSGWKIQVLFDI